MVRIQKRIPTISQTINAHEVRRLLYWSTMGGGYDEAGRRFESTILYPGRLPCFPSAVVSKGMNA